MAYQPISPASAKPVKSARASKPPIPDRGQNGVVQNPATKMSTPSDLALNGGDDYELLFTVRSRQDPPSSAHLPWRRADSHRRNHQKPSPHLGSPNRRFTPFTPGWLGPLPLKEIVIGARSAEASLPSEYWRTKMFLRSARVERKTEYAAAAAIGLELHGAAASRQGRVLGALCLWRFVCGALFVALCSERSREWARFYRTGSRTAVEVPP